MQVHAYLNFGGECAEAFRHCAAVFGGELEIMTHGDSPMAGEVPPEWHGRVLHAALAMGDQLLMGSDAPPESHQAPQGM